jgi:hypothetical protein
MLSCGEHSSEFMAYAEGWNKSWASVNTLMNVGLRMS